MGMSAWMADLIQLLGAARRGLTGRSATRIARSGRHSLQPSKRGSSRVSTSQPLGRGQAADNPAMTSLKGDLPADALRVLAAASCSETVHRGFRTVWHCWGAGRQLVLSLPLDAIYGEEDALYTGRMNDVEALLRRAPSFGQMVRIPGAGHWVQYENPSRFNASLLGLLG